MLDARSHVTGLTRRLGSGDQGVAEELLPLVYGELRSLARSYLRGRDAGHTLQPTALVHEVFLRMTESDELEVAGKAHFIGLAARTMRLVLVDHARRRGALKRGGRVQRVTLQGVMADEGEHVIEVLALHDALSKLAELDPRQSRIVELRFFGGLSGDEIAQVLEISRATVVRDLQMARAWLLREMDGAPSSDR